MLHYYLVPIAFIVVTFAASYAILKKETTDNALLIFIIGAFYIVMGIFYNLMDHGIDPEKFPLIPSDIYITIFLSVIFFVAIIRTIVNFMNKKNTTIIKKQKKRNRS